MSKIKLGSHVRDIYTGFEGVAICSTEWLNGCVRVGIQPLTLKDGETIGIETFDVQQIEVIAKKAPTSAQVKKAAKTGGPRPDPKRPADPTR